VTSRSSDLHPVELALLGLCGVLLSAALALWLIGGVAGAVFADGWVSVPLGELLAVGTRLPDHLADPRAAWPEASRSSLPGVWGFVASAAVLAIAALAVIGTAVRKLGRGARAGANSARWASGSDLRALRVGTRPEFRIVLGHHRRHRLAAESRQSVLVVAPTQSGKTTGLAIPAILDWPGPVLATSIKTDLVRDTREARSARGDVRIFDPSATTGLDRASWTPLASCTTWEGARRTADRLTRATQASAQSLHDAQFWSQAATRFLAPLLHAAALAGHDIGDVARWIDTDEQEEILVALAGPEHAPARNALMAAWSADDRLRSSLSLTASLALEAYNDPAVLECGRAAEITPDWLLSAANTVYLCAPVDEQARLRPLFVTLVREVVATVYARASATGRPIDPPLLIVLDEAANIAPIPDLDQLASTGAGQGLQLVTVVQDLAQVHERWGGRADTVVNNHRAKLFGAGTTCARTLGYLSKVLGDAAVQQSSTTAGEQGRRSTTESTTFRPLAPPHLVREADRGDLLLLYGSIPPAVVKTRPWFRDRRFRQVARRPEQ
jgi:type IV secretion system protein VirD4